jgi:fructose-1,6-bisphosphatase/inositol monophosphatase family enzyme
LTFDDADLDSLAALLAEVADAEIMPRFRRLEPGGIRRKTSISDLVTDADEEAERIVSARLRERYAGALVVGEEACEKDRSLLDALPEAELALVLDPVDGTFNFASGVPLFGVMLAVVRRGETIAGIIYDPVARSWALGAKGAGARFVAADGASTPARVASKAGEIGAAIGAASWQYFGEPERSALARNCIRLHSQINYRCAAHEYRLLASGVTHFSAYAKLMPWDHLAGVLIHSEAGGFSAMLDGSPFRAGRTAGGLLLAPSRDDWDMLRRELWAA